MSRAWFAGLAAWQHHAARVPVADVPHRAKTLRKSRFLQMNRVLVPVAGKRCSAQQSIPRRRERVVDAHRTRFSPWNRVAAGKNPFSQIVARMAQRIE